MILNGFDIGWQEAFEKRLSYLKELFPELKYKTPTRHNAMLRVEADLKDDPLGQQVIDNVLYCIERDSAKTCEACGNGGRRITKEEYFDEPKTLCITCYALILDEIIQALDK